MGYGVYCKNENIWNPSLLVGDYFLGSIRMLEKLLETESGVTSPMADHIEIEAAKLNAFVSKVMDYVEQTNNTPLFIMMSGITEILIRLNAKINNFEPESKVTNRLLIERSKFVFYPLSDYIQQSLDIGAL